MRVSLSPYCTFRTLNARWLHVMHLDHDWIGGFRGPLSRGPLQGKFFISAESEGMTEPIQHFIRLPRELTLKNIPEFLTPGIFAAENTSLISIHSAVHELIEPVGLVALFAIISEAVAKASGPLQLKMDKFKNIEYFQRMDFFNDWGLRFPRNSINGRYRAPRCRSKRFVDRKILR